MGITMHRRKALQTRKQVGVGAYKLANSWQQALHNRNIKERGMMGLPVADPCLETMQETVGRVGELTNCPVLSERLLVQPGEGTRVRLQIGSIPGGLQLPGEIVEQHVGLVELRAAEVDDKGTRANTCWYKLEHVILTLQRTLRLGLAEPNTQIKALCLIDGDQHIQVGLTLPKQRCFNLVNLFQAKHLAVTLDNCSNRFVRRNLHV